MSSPPRFRLLGPVGASIGDHDVDLGGPKPRAVLTLLALEAGRPVGVGRLLEVVWGGSPPPRAEASLRGYVSGLRKALGGDPDRITFVDGGYLLRADADAIDLRRFDRQVEAGHAALRTGEAATARALLTDALGEWRGSALGSIGELEGLRDVVARLSTRRQEADEALVDARLALGEHDALLAELAAAVAAEPLREKRWAQQALALYRAGRPVDALRSIDEARRVLDEEVGVRPGPELVALEQAMLDHDPALLVGPVDVVAGDGAPFVGREREVALLGAALRDASGVVLVSGDAGIGKTSLVARVTAVGRRPVAWGQCADVTAGAALHPWLAVAAALPGSSLGDALGACAPGEDPAAGRLRMATAITGALVDAGRPVVVIDDVQWADEASLRLLELVAVAGRQVPTVVVLTLRTPLVDPSAALVDCLGSLARAPEFSRIELDGLGEPDVARWASLLGTAGDPGLARELHARTDGNPFFTGELLALLAGGGSIDRVPTAVQDVIRRRVARLPAAVQPALAAAAVLGGSFDVDVVAAMVDAPAGEVLDLLSSALDAAVLAAGSAPGVLAFVHGLVAETLAAELNPVRAAQLHAAAASAIASLHGTGEDTVDALARHAYEGIDAGSAADAVRWCTAAARRASGHHADADAAVQLDRALRALLRAAPGDRSQQLGLLVELGGARARSGDVQSARSTLASAAELAEELGDVATMAAVLAQVNADDLWSSLDWAQHDSRTLALVDRALVAVGRGDSAARAELLAAKAALRYYDDAAAEERDRVSAEAVAVASRVGDRRTTGRVLLQRYWAMWRPSGNVERTVTADALVDLVRGGVGPERFAPVAHLARFAAAYERADASVATVSLAAARAVSDPVRTPSAWSYVCYAEVSVSLLQGRYDDADREIAEVHEAFWRTRRFVADTTRAVLAALVASDRGETDDALAALDLFAGTAYGPSVCWLRAFVLAEAGRHAAAAAALATFDGPLLDDWYRLVILTAAVHAAATVGDVEFLDRWAGELEPFAGLLAQAGSGGMVLGPVALALGRAAGARGDSAAAGRWLAAGLEVAERMSARPWVARGLAARWALSGDPADRDEARRIAEAIGMRVPAAAIGGAT